MAFCFGDGEVTAGVVTQVTVKVVEMLSRLGQDLAWTDTIGGPNWARTFSY